MTQLADRTCGPCEGGTEPLDESGIAEFRGAIHTSWQLADDGKSIVRLFEFPVFSRTIAFSNAVAWIATVEGHHPEMRIRYGSCEVRYTTTAIGGLSENDFICAAKVDRLVEDEIDELEVSIADIEAAAQRIKPVVVETPLLRSAELDERVGGRVLIKPECLQRTGSFKIRGAYNLMSQLDSAQASRGVVAWSSGNHAQGVAAAGALLDIHTAIVMPEDAPPAQNCEHSKAGRRAGAL